MRTTKKEFKVQIQDHIINSVLSDEYGDTIKEQLQAVIDNFKDYYGAYEQKRKPNIQEAFIDWALGLPSAFNIEYRNFEIQELIKTWFTIAGETYKEPKDDQKHTIYIIGLVFRELNNLFKQNKLSLY
jgi:methionyl-tRNA synthetase